MITIYLICIFLGTLIINMSEEINKSYNNSIIDVPYSLKCYFKEENCEKGNVVMGDILQFIIFFILGYQYPNHHFDIIFWSIIFELFMYHQIKYMNAKFIISPLIKITAYSLGTLYLKK